MSPTSRMRLVLLGTLIPLGILLAVLVQGSIGGGGPRTPPRSIPTTAPPAQPPRLPRERRHGDLGDGAGAMAEAAWRGFVSPRVRLYRRSPSTGQSAKGGRAWT